MLSLALRGSEVPSAIVDYYNHDIPWLTFKGEAEIVLAPSGIRVSENRSYRDCDAE